MAPRGPDNGEIADLLERIADLLEAQDANPYRVRAYRNAASALRGTLPPVVDVLGAEGRRGLVALPAIGKSISAAIDEYVHTGRVGILDRLEGQVSPEDLFTTVPGIGDDLAHRIHEQLEIETLEELELAAHDGRLARVKGFGERRVHGIRDALAGIMSRSARRRARRIRSAGTRLHAEDGPADRPAVGTVLAVDEAYRRGAERGDLRRIAPRRFNPEGKAWLPVLHVERDGWAFTAMFSNTARAHQLGTTRDWVVLYYERDGHEDQCTVVTERQGPLTGRRVVRGREAETARYYADSSP
ncbi:MAG: helix-hairpin-helix domain-containing protein [Planctomycetota bacterium]|jgi:hypothetical protein